MKIAFVPTGRRGETDMLLTRVAETLMGRGSHVAGLVQYNTDCGSGKCDMDVRVLPDGPMVRISQSLGPEARGCRLDAGALEMAVGEIQAAMARDTQIVILNKFGKHEAEGRGLRVVIAEAMERGIPVICGVNGLNREAFNSFTGGIAEELPAEEGAVTAWALQALCLDERHATA